MCNSLISVIMPVYNAEKYVSAAIQSVLAQSFSEIEFIIINDGSSDKSLDIIYGFHDPRIKVINNYNNIGYPASMNLGIGIAKGAFIARMDADDVSAPQRLEKQYYFLLGHQEFSFIGCRPFYLTPNGKELRPKPSEYSFITEDWEKIIKKTRVFADPSVLIQKDSVQFVGGYQVYQRSGQDTDLWLRILELGRPMATLMDPLYGQRLLPNSITYLSRATEYNVIPRFFSLQRKFHNQNCSDIIQTELALFDSLFSSQNFKNPIRKKLRRLTNLLLICIESGDYYGAWEIIITSYKFSSDINQFREFGFIIFSLIKIFLQKSFKKTQGQDILYKYGYYFTE